MFYYFFVLKICNKQIKHLMKTFARTSLLYNIDKGTKLMPFDKIHLKATRQKYIMLALYATAIRHSRCGTVSFA